MARSSRQQCCTQYVTVPVTVEVSFPADMVICDICDFCRAENNGTRFRCLLTSKILPYHNKTIGLHCPLGIQQMNQAEIEEEEVSD